MHREKIRQVHNKEFLSDLEALIDTGQNILEFHMWKNLTAKLVFKEMKNNMMEKTNLERQQLQQFYLEPLL